MVNLFGFELTSEEKEELLEEIEKHASHEDTVNLCIESIELCIPKRKQIKTAIGTINITADLYNKLVSKKCFGTVVTLLVASDIILSSEIHPNSSAYKFFLAVKAESREITYKTVSIILNSNSVDVSFPEVLTKTQFESFLRCEKIVYINEEISSKLK